MGQSRLLPTVGVLPGVLQVCRGWDVEAVVLGTSVETFLSWLSTCSPALLRLHLQILDGCLLCV